MNFVFNRIENSMIPKLLFWKWILNCNELYELHQRRQKQSKKDTMKPQMLKSSHSKKVLFVSKLLFKENEDYRSLHSSIVCRRSPPLPGAFTSPIFIFFIPSPAGQWLWSSSSARVFFANHIYTCSSWSFRGILLYINALCDVFHSHV